MDIESALMKLKKDNNFYPVYGSDGKVLYYKVTYSDISNFAKAIYSMREDKNGY